MAQIKTSTTEIVEILGILETLAPGLDTAPIKKIFDGTIVEGDLTITKKVGDDEFILEIIITK